MNNKNLMFTGAVLLAMFFWSFSFVWFKIAFLAYKPITIVLFRLIISCALLFSVSKLTRKLQKIKPEDLKKFILLAFFEPFLYFMGESYGLLYVSSTVAAVIVATIPLFTPFAAWYFYKERLSGANITGLLVSFIGVSVVVLNRSLELTASPLGVSLVFLAVLSTVGYASILKGLAGRYNTFSIIAWQNFFGMFMFLPFWLFIDLKDFLQTPFHPQAFGAIVKLAIFASTLAFVFFTYSVRNLGINRTNAFVNVIPIFVAILAYFILDEILTLQQMIGITITITGLFLAQIRRKSKNGTTPLYQP